MSEKSSTVRKTNKSRLHFFGSATRKNKSHKKDHPCLDNNFQDHSNDIHYEKDSLLDCEPIKVELTKRHEKEDKKQKLSESLKNAGKNLLPHLPGTTHRHKKLTRQSTIDIGDIKSAIKAQENKQTKAGGNRGEKYEDIVPSRAGSLRSLAHLDLAEVSHSHRRTAVCDELEKFTVVREGKTLHTLRKDLLTFQRLKEWSFL